MKSTNLENRLVAFASLIIQMTEKLTTTFANQHLSKQIIRSATSAALNYGEAQEAESRADFIHKMKITLKELKETQVCLKILIHSTSTQTNHINQAFKESCELVAIFISSIKTARSKRSQ